MYDPVPDFSFYQAGVSELQDYLLSEELFWQLSFTRKGTLPKLTIGGLLLARKRLESAEANDLGVLDTEMHRLHSKWLAAWRRKVGCEVRARTELWNNFLLDYRQNPEQSADAYPQEVRWRVMIHLLLQEMDNLPPETEALTEMDRVLRFSFVPGRFIWDEDLLPGFPRDPYWFLYGNLKA